MGQIYTEFTKEGIEIPHPKRDIQVFFPEGTSAEIKNPEIVVKENPLTKNASKEISPNENPQQENSSTENPLGKAL